MSLLPSFILFVLVVTKMKPSDITQNGTVRFSVSVSRRSVSLPVIDLYTYTVILLFAQMLEVTTPPAPAIVRVLHVHVAM